MSAGHEGAVYSSLITFAVDSIDRIEMERVANIMVKNQEWGQNSSRLHESNSALHNEVDIHYDKEPFYTNYTSKRDSKMNANYLIEHPNLKGLIPSMKHKVVLDLGCGMGDYIVEYMKDAKHVDAVDISGKMLARLRRNILQHRMTNVNIVQSPVETFQYKEAYYDVILSTLVFHYIADLGPVFSAIYRALKPGGLFIFNVEHPVLTATRQIGWEMDISGKPAHWRLDDYFDTGKRKTHWYGMQVDKYHRTLEDYFRLLIDNGFLIEALLEPKPSDDVRRINEEMDSHYRRPIFLMMSLRKPDSSR